MPATVAELRDGQEVPFPDERWNAPSSDDDGAAFVSVQSIVVDPADRLWILDTGSPMFQATKPGGPKLVCIALTNDTAVQTITFDPEVALETTYLTDSADSGPNGIIVVDLASGRAWRRCTSIPPPRRTSRRICGWWSRACSSWSALRTVRRRR